MHAVKLLADFCLCSCYVFIVGFKFSRGDILITKFNKHKYYHRGILHVDDM